MMLFDVLYGFKSIHLSLIEFVCKYVLNLCYCILNVAV